MSVPIRITNQDTVATVVTDSQTAAAGAMSKTIPAGTAGATVAMPSQAWYFDPPLPATALGAAITVAVPSFGSGNTAAGLVITGYQA